MRIRTQNLIAIVPLFVGMAVAAGALAYSTERVETIWGLEEEATSLAVAIAEFVDGDQLLASAAAGDPVARFDSLRISFDRIVAHGQAKHIFALTPVGTGMWSVTEGQPVLEVDVAANELFVPPDSLLRPTAAEMEQLASDGTPVVREVVRLPGDIGVMTAFAPIAASTGELAGILGVVIDAERLQLLARGLPLSLGRLVLIALVIGTLTSLLISSLLTHRVKALSRAALEVAAGDYDRQIQIGTIQELSDLSNTFNTMSSVLKDLIERARRTLIDGEQYRTQMDLAQTYRKEVWTDLNRSYDGVQVVSRAIGDGHPGDLYGVVEQGGLVCVYIGRVTEASQMDSAIAAAAGRRAIEAGAARWPLPEVFGEVSRLLRVKLETVSWTPGENAGAQITTYEGHSEARTAPLPLDSDQTTLLHTFPSRSGEALQRWKRVFQQMPPENLVLNLARTMEPEAIGTLVAIGSAQLSGVGADVAPVTTNTWRGEG